MTFASPLTRIEPPRINPELAALNSWLDYNRATLLGKLDGRGPNSRQGSGWSTRAPPCTGCSGT